MAYDGWIEFNGQELINLSRTAQLAESLGIDTVWTDPADVAWIQTALGGVNYDLVTSAPWYDAGYPASGEFAGFIPLGFPGLDDSTLSSTPVEYITDGGHSGKPRNSTLSIVGSIAVVASTERGAEYGKRWLDRLLRGTGLDSQRPFCTGADLRYFRWADASAPVAHRRDVRLTRGATVTRKRTTDCSSTWLVTCTLTAADPYEYGEQAQVLARLGTTTSEVTLPAPVAKNLITNPAFQSGTTGWAVLGTGTAISSVASPTPPSAPGITTTKVLQITDDGSSASPGVGAQLSGTDIAITGNTTYRVIAWFRGPAGKTLRARVVESVGGTQGVSLDVVVTSSTEWYKVAGTITTSAGATNLDVRLMEPNETAAITFYATCIMVTQGSTAWDYFDGDSPSTYDPITDTWTIHKWDGTPYASTSSKYQISGAAVGGAITEAGSLVMLEQSCPVWDYSPVYDPLYPALVASPTAPDFYPDGWYITEGMTFNRYWARLSPVEPSGLMVVPVITLTTLTEARMVRVSIWPSTSDFDDQCDPLFTAVVSYLPAGVEFTIDGEQQAAYVWDGISPAVRRADSLVYGTDATPIQWTAFNDPGQMLVTLDLFSESGIEEGLGDVEMSLAFVPKSD